MALWYTVAVTGAALAAVPLLGGARLQGAAASSPRLAYFLANPAGQLVGIVGLLACLFLLRYLLLTLFNPRR
jgi:hypothetical protein